MKFSRAERDRRTDAALAAGRYRITGHCSTTAVEVVNLHICNVVNGRCEVCGARPGPIENPDWERRLPGENDATYWKRFWRLNQERIEAYERDPERKEREGCFSLTVSGPPGLLAILEDQANPEDAAESAVKRKAHYAATNAANNRSPEYLETLRVDCLRAANDRLRDADPQEVVRAAAADFEARLRFLTEENEK